MKKVTTKKKRIITKVYDLEDLSQYEFLHEFIDLSLKLQEIATIARSIQNENEVLNKSNRTNLTKMLRFLSMFKSECENRMFEKLRGKDLTESQRTKLLNIFFGDILFDKLENKK